MNWQEVKNYIGKGGEIVLYPRRAVAFTRIGALGREIELRTFHALLRRGLVKHEPQDYDTKKSQTYRPI